MRAFPPPPAIAALVALVALVASAACSLFDPSVGPLQSDGAASAASTCNLGAAGYGTTYGAPSGQTAMNDFCTADGGTVESACDECEATSCCASRVTCYSDRGCSCADTSLDACLGAAPDAGGKATTETAGCWTAFAASSSIAAARYACLMSACKSPCQIAN